MIKYSLVGYDSSESSRRAFHFAVELARATSGRVRVVYVVPLAQNGGDASSLLMMVDSEKRTLEVRQELTELIPDIDDLVDVALVVGSPGDELIDQVRQCGVDHIVIGHTERGNLARWLLGSVSDDVLARAHVPVTVVR